MNRNIILCLLLTTLVVQQGFNTKTKLQQLAEGRIDTNTLKSRKSKKSINKKEKTKNDKVVEKRIFSKRS